MDANATTTGSSKAHARQSLAAYVEWSQTAPSTADEGCSVYAWLDAHASAVRASEIDLGLDDDLATAARQVARDAMALTTKIRGVLSGEVTARFTHAADE